MKHLQTYQQLNESQKMNNFLEDLLKSMCEKIDSKKISHFLLPFKKEMDSLCKKYYINGKVDADRIYSDLKSFDLTTESYWEPTYDEDKKNNVVLRWLYKFFVKWPKGFVTGLWDIFKITVIDPWGDGALGKSLSILMSGCYILVGILVYIISVYSFLFFDMKMNGLTHGKVEGESFEKAHSETRTMTTMAGKTPITTVYTVWVEDRWFIQVKGDNGRVEDWVTYNPQVGNQTGDGSEVTKDNNWSWSNTEKR